ncbi:MAG: hypothetical protein GC134_06450 [Proteobacteria bacterium]|nr:hypothetical protein [Pseudomonadota bacterium]
MKNNFVQSAVRVYLDYQEIILGYAVIMACLSYFSLRGYGTAHTALRSGYCAVGIWLYYEAHGKFPNFGAIKKIVLRHLKCLWKALIYVLPVMVVAGGCSHLLLANILSEKTSIVSAVVAVFFVMMRVIVKNGLIAFAAFYAPSKTYQEIAELIQPFLPVVVKYQMVIAALNIFVMLSYNSVSHYPGVMNVVINIGLAAWGTLLGITFYVISIVVMRWIGLAEDVQDAG